MIRECDRDLGFRYHHTLEVGNRGHFPPQRPDKQYLQRTIHRHHQSQSALVHHPAPSALVHHPAPSAGPGQCRLSRSHSLGRVVRVDQVAKSNTIEMATLQQKQRIKTNTTSPTPNPRAPGGKDTATNSPATATSSVASSSTVGEIVDL